MVEDLETLLRLAGDSNHAVRIEDGNKWSIVEGDIYWCGNGCDCCEDQPIGYLNTIIHSGSLEGLIDLYNKYWEEMG